MSLASQKDQVKSEWWQICFTYFQDRWHWILVYPAPDFYMLDLDLCEYLQQLSLLLKEAMKGQNKTVTKAHLMEAVSKFLIRNTCDSSFSLMENREVKLENQQKQLEVRLHIFYRFDWYVNHICLCASPVNFSCSFVISSKHVLKMCKWFLNKWNNIYIFPMRIEK